MRTRLSATLLFALTCVASVGQGQEGVIYVGDMESVDRAVLEAADLTLPPLQGAAKPMSAPTQPPVAQAPAVSAVKPVAFQAGMQPAPGSTPAKLQAKPKQRGLFGSLKKPSWLFGKKEESKPSDPFANAAQQAKLDLMRQGQRDPRVKPIPTHPGVAPKQAITTAGYQQKQPMAKKRQANLNGGLNLRPTNTPRRGLLSGLWDDSSKKPPMAKAPAKPMTKPAGLASSQGPSAGKPRSSKLRPGSGTKSSKTSSAPALIAARPTPPPMKKAPVVIKPRPVTKPTPQTGQITNRFVVGATTETMEPPGDFVMISDDTPAPVAKAAAEAKPLVSSTEETKPMVVLGVPEPKKSSEVEVLMPPTPQPMPEPQVVQTTPKALPIAMKPATKPAPRPTTINRYATTAPFPQTTPQPEQPAEPSERSKALLAEAHQLAATAASYDEFSAVVKRCRYVLAIDASPLALSYANQLAGWALTKRGDTLDEASRFVEARTDYHEALRCDAECWRAEHALGVLAAREGDAGVALQHFDRTIELNPEFAKAFSNRAALSVQAGGYQAALKDYQQAIEIDPDLAVAHIGRGRVCHMLGLLDEGLRHLDAAEVLSPADAMIATGRGDLLTDLGRYGQALQAYQRAIQLDPASSAAHRNLAWMQATCPVEAFRDGESALQHAEAAASLAAGSDDLTLDTKAAALAAVGRFDEATETQRQAIELAPESDAAVYRERLAMYERGESFTSKPVAVQQASYLR